VHSGQKRKRTVKELEKNRENLEKLKKRKKEDNRQNFLASECGYSICFLEHKRIHGRNSIVLFPGVLQLFPHYSEEELYNENKDGDSTALKLARNAFDYLLRYANEIY